MIDTHLLLDDYEETSRRLARKGVDPSLPADARRLAQRRREQVRQVDEARQHAKEGASRIGTLMRDGNTDAAEQLRREMAAARTRLEGLEARLRDTEAELEDVVLRIPNLPDDSVPDGAGEADNVVLRTHGYDPADYAGRTWAPHWEVAERLGIFDGERAAKLSGSMFVRTTRRWSPTLAQPHVAGAGYPS